MIFESQGLSLSRGAFMCRAQLRLSAVILQEPKSVPKKNLDFQAFSYW